MGLATSLLRLTLSGLRHFGIARALSPLTRGAGAVLMLHHVAPAPPKGFAPNGILSITPEFLEALIERLKAEGYDFVSMDEAVARLRGDVPVPRRFLAFTFDDGYRDNRDHAYPVLKRHGVPMTIYVASDFARHRGFLWWIVLERVIATRHFLALEMNGRLETFACGSDRAKASAFDRIYWWLRSLPEDDARDIVSHLARETGIDIFGPCAELAMTWPEIEALAADPLVTIGAHTVSHRALAGLSPSRTQTEIAASVADVEAHLGRPCRHFCFPYGDEASAGEREFDMVARLGLASAVTTRKGLLAAHHRTATAALPRLSLNGDFQDIAYVETLLTGVPFALRDLARSVHGRLRRRYSPAVTSGLCIQRTSHAAGTTQANPPTM